MTDGRSLRCNAVGWRLLGFFVVVPLAIGALFLVMMGALGFFLAFAG